MNQKRIVSCCLFLLFTLIASAQIINFNDLDFKQALLDHEQINTNGDDEIQQSEAEAFEGPLLLGNLGISDLSGIEYFTSIKHLDVGGNFLTELDISSNVSLKRLFCYFNNLTTLQLGSNEALEFVMCDGNDFEYFYLEHPYLDTLVFRHNNIANPTIEIAEENSITYFDINDNLMSYFDPFNLSKAKTIRVYVNNFTTLDFTGNTELEVLDCSINPLEKINLLENHKLRELNIGATSLPEIHLLNNPELEKLYADYTVFSTLDLSENSMLSKVDLYYSRVKSVNVKNGNNEALSFSALLNDSLQCVQVDDSLYSVMYWFQVEPQVVFRENCPEFVQTSLQDTEQLTFKMEPNPSPNNVKILGLEESVEVEIFTQQGQLVFQQKLAAREEQRLLTNLANGMYYIKVKSENQSITKALIILE